MGMTQEKMHVFEQAGLGRAPYQFTGLRVAVGPIEIAPGHLVGSAGQPMGTCRFCGRGIRDCYGLRAADGREFEVGSECIRKAGDRGLRGIVTEEERKKRHIREATAIEAGKALAQSRRAELEAIPSGRPGESLAVQFDWYMTHAGNKGKLWIIGKIRKAIGANNAK